MLFNSYFQIKSRTPLRWTRARTRLREGPAIAGNILISMGVSQKISDISSDQYSVGFATPLRKRVSNQ